jgi:hypothetical protein
MRAAKDHEDPLGTQDRRIGHATLHRTPPPQTKIWRYMDFTKFVFMLEERALFFSRADHLLDPFEGRSSVRGDEETLEESGERSDRTPSLDAGENLRRRFFINSWHINDHESMAMWKLFAKSDDAIAVESSYERLRTCLPTCLDASGEPEAGHVDVALVEYVDPSCEPSELPFDFCQFLRKRKEFEHERELRALFDISRGEGQTRKVDLAEDAGRLVDVDLHQLMAQIHLPPGSPGWYQGLVVRLLDRFGIDVEVKPSDLERRTIING